jgi:TolB-like protein
LGFFSELKRRNVFRVSGVYAIVGWLLLQVATALEEVMGLPEWFDAFVLAVLLIGFPLALIFAWAFELTPEGLKRTADVDPDESITARTGSRLDVFLVLGLFAFAAALLLPRFFPQLGSGPASSVGDAGRGSGAVAESGADASIAVLPFAKHVGGPGPGVLRRRRVRGTAQQARPARRAQGRRTHLLLRVQGRNENLQDIGRVLNVAHILEGSVRTQGKRIRVTAQLIQVSDGFHLWSDTYDRNLEDIFAVQDDIALQITRALRERLLLADTMQVAPSQRAATGAYERFLRARDLIYQRKREPMQRAIELLTEGIAIDPEYAALFAARAKALALQESYGWSSGRSNVDRALADVETALAMDDMLSDAYAVRGLIRRTRGESDLALSDLRYALEANPSDIDARLWYSQALGRAGQFRERFRQLQRLFDIDPLYPPAVNNLVAAALAVGEVVTAQATVDRADELTNDNPRLAFERANVDRARGRWASAIELMQSLPAAMLRGPYAIELGLVYWAVGEKPVERVPELPDIFAMYVRAWDGGRQEPVAWARDVLATSRDFSYQHPAAILVLYAAGENRLLADYFAREYDNDVESFWARMRSSEIRVLPPYFEMAQALRAVGDDGLADQLLQRGRLILDRYEAGGYRGLELYEFNAVYWALSGDASRAIDWLRRYMEVSTIPAWFFALPALEPLRTDERFAALRRANLERVNAERAKLDFAALSDAYYDG